jgi:transposase
MPKKLPLENHLETAELEQRYRGARDPVERAHYQIIWLLSQGRSTGEVAAVTGYSRSWIRSIVRRYNERGTAGLGDRRHQNPGGAERALLGPQLREELDAALQAPPPDGGLWSSRKVADWIAQRTGRPTGVQRGWEYLRRFGYTPQVPRPAHAKADPDQQEHFRKNSACGSHR